MQVLDSYRRLSCFYLLRLKPYIAAVLSNSRRTLRRAGFCEPLLLPLQQGCSRCRLQATRLNTAFNRWRGVLPSIARR